MTNMFDEQIIDGYKQIFGVQKLQDFWVDFLQKYDSELGNVQSKTSEEVRFMIHNLRSNSKIFGMIQLSERCSQMEEKLVSGKDLKNLEKDLLGIKECYNQSVDIVTKWIKR